MKKGDRFEGTIHRVDFPNICRIETEAGDKITVKNGIPGQKVYGFIQKKRSGRLGGRILEVREKSPLETREPLCSQFPECGGCMYQTMAYEEQLKMKEQQVRKLMDDAIRAAGQTDEAGEQGDRCTSRFPVDALEASTRSSISRFSRSDWRTRTFAYSVMCAFSHGSALIDRKSVV